MSYSTQYRGKTAKPADLFISVLLSKHNAIKVEDRCSRDNCVNGMTILTNIFSHRYRMLISTIQCFCSSLTF